MNANIPFFTDLPPKAIKAACRLWDKIQSPDYNGITAYHDFCHDLLTAAITPPPPRAIVKRWAAGVQAGLIERPASVSEVPGARKAQPVPTLEELEEPAEAWSPYRLPPKGKAERKARMKADVLVTDEAAGVPFQPVATTVMDEATREIVSVAIDDGASEFVGMETVLDDLGIRPMADPAEPFSARPMEAAFKGDQFAAVIDNAEALLDALGSSAPIASLPGSTLQFQEQPALLAVRTAAGRLLEETIIQLSQSIERTARETTARMLRDVADELERQPS